MNAGQQFALRDPQSAIEGFIQAGGRSSRMGRDKAWMEIDGAPMIERVIAAAGPAVSSLGIIINAANPQIGRYERLARSCGARLIFDLHERLGPLGGIHTALAHCQIARSALILACDLPFITTEFLSFLRDIHLAEDSQSITVPLDQSNRLQPLAAVYDRSLASTVERMLAADELKLDLLCSRVSTRRVSYAEFSHLRGAARLFTNINTPEEYSGASGQVT